MRDFKSFLGENLNEEKDFYIKYANEVNKKLKEIGIKNVKITSNDIKKVEGTSFKKIKEIKLSDPSIFGILKSIISSGTIRISMYLRGEDLVLKLEFRWKHTTGGSNGDDITFHFDGESWEIW